MKHHPSLSAESRPAPGGDDFFCGVVASRENRTGTGAGQQKAVVKTDPRSGEVEDDFALTRAAEGRVGAEAGGGEFSPVRAPAMPPLTDDECGCAQCRAETPQIETPQIETHHPDPLPQGEREQREEVDE